MAPSSRYPRPQPTLRRRSLVGAVTLSLMTLAVGGCAGAKTAAPTDAATATPVPIPTSTPTPTPIDPALAYARSRLATMTLEEKVAGLFLLHKPGTDGVAANAFAAQTGAAGLILMGDNIPGSPEELAALISASSPDPELPLVIGIDEEGGDVQRLPWDPAPGAAVLAGQAPEATAAAFAARAAVLEAAGVNLNFGVVADVSSGPESFIDSRSFGRDPTSAGDRVAAAVAAENGRVLSTLKHSPGHGSAPGDSHTSVPATSKSLDEWRRFDAIPFQRGIAAGADAVMMGHLAYTSVDSAPASLSPAWHDIVRRELGFDGVIVTDDMLMLPDTGLAEYQDAGENAVRAVAAGSTLLLYVLPADPATVGADPAVLRDAIVAAVHAGRIPLAQIDDAALRLLRLRRTLALS